MPPVERSRVSLVLLYGAEPVFFDGVVGALLFLMFAVSRETANICLPIVGIQVKQKFVW